MISRFKKRLPGWIQKTALTRHWVYTPSRTPGLLNRIDDGITQPVHVDVKRNRTFASESSSKLPEKFDHLSASLTVDGHAVQVEAHEFRGSPEIDTAISCCDSSSLPSQHQRTQ
ncbi:hypothetical protein EYC80_008879 [Monilinia laxa]|uniref:Uncharacterized protein n=1 Tax=Monilinia laxa TaxID=61186 RepID=A0A5N6K1P0_MONLA|nr:hypothetical protein EYC80_008879 [Monilinia laxa]